MGTLRQMSRPSRINKTKNQNKHTMKDEKRKVICIDEDDDDDVQMNTQAPNPSSSSTPSRSPQVRINRVSKSNQSSSSSNVVVVVDDDDDDDDDDKDDSIPKDAPRNDRRVRQTIPMPNNNHKIHQFFKREKKMKTKTEKRATTGSSSNDSVSVSAGQRTNSTNSTTPITAQTTTSTSSVVVNILDHRVHFPYEPYESQVLFMTKIIECLSHDIGTPWHGLLESPTGTGKSLSLLCSTLSWQETFKARKIQEWKDWYANGQPQQNQKQDHVPSNSFNSSTSSSSSSSSSSASSSSSSANHNNNAEMRDSSSNSSSGGHKRKLQDISPPVSSSSSPSSSSSTSTSNSHFPIPTDLLDTLDTLINEIPLKKLKYNEKNEIVLGSESIPLPIDVAQTVRADSSKTKQQQLQRKETNQIIGLMRRGFHHKAEEHILRSSLFSGPQKRKDKSIVPTIFFASRTHSQLKQVIRELKKTSYNPDMVVLGSREHYCIHPKVRKSNKKNEECTKLTETSSCRYQVRAEGLAEDSALLPDGPMHIFDIEELVALGEKKSGCPYFASRVLLKRAQIVFCPYNYLIEPIIRNAMGIDLENSIVVLDEAHNIEDVCRDAASGTFQMDEIDDACDDLKLVIEANILVNSHTTMLTLLGKIKSWILQTEPKMMKTQSGTSIYTMRTKSAIFDMLTCFGITEFLSPDVPFCTSRLYLTLLEIAQNASTAASNKEDPHLSTKTLVLLEHLFYTFEFMTRGNQKFLGDYAVSTQKKPKYQYKSKSVSRFSAKSHASEYEVSIHLWCMNPAVAFEDLKTKCHSVLLTSGTLSPLSSFSSELDTPFPVTYEAPHVIDLKRQVWIGQLSIGPNAVKMNASYSKASLLDFQDSLGQLIHDVSTIVPYGVLLFFPSYSLMDNLMDRWQQTGLLNKLQLRKQVYTEPRANNKECNFTDTMNSYYETIENDEGALFIAVCRGRISEGIDLKDNFCRAVIVVGIPFPNVTDALISEKRKYNDEKVRVHPHRINGQIWYTQQAYRAVNQAIGRCLRHRYDYGAILFVDERYRDQGAINNLSKWVKSNVECFDSYMAGLDSLKQFFLTLEREPIRPPIKPHSDVSEVTEERKHQNEMSSTCPSTQLMPPPSLNNSVKIEDLTQVDDGFPPTQIIKVETVKRSVAQPSLTQTIVTENPSSGEQTLLRCISCGMIVVEPKVRSEAVLNLNADLVLSDLQKVRQAESQSEIDHGQIFQIPATMKNRPCPFKVYVTNVLPMSAVDGNCLSENTVKIYGTTKKFLSKSNVRQTNGGFTVNTGWCDEDGMMYELLFCRSCKKQFVGVFVKSTDATHLEHLNELFILPESVTQDNQIDVDSQTLESFSQLATPTSFSQIQSWK